jgi:hypothetical protein
MLPGLAIFAAIAAWQFYLFATFKGSVVDVQGGTIHLWVAVAIGLITCAGAFFVISSFRNDRRNEMRIASQRSSLR